MAESVVCDVDAHTMHRPSHVFFSFVFFVLLIFLV